MYFIIVRSIVLFEILLQIIEKKQKKKTVKNFALPSMVKRKFIEGIKKKSFLKFSKRFKYLKYSIHYTCT